MFKNLFALVGLASVIACVTLYLGVKNSWPIPGFDPGATKTYTEMVTKIIETKDGAGATIWRFPVEEGLTAEEVEETMKSVANELNMAKVGELPLSLDISAKKGTDYRFVKIFLFCDSLTAATMLDYNDAFSAYLPCRISLIEDNTGKLWLYTLNMDLMIHGGKPLPPKLKEKAEKVKSIILEIMQRGAEGDF